MIERANRLREDMIKSSQKTTDPLLNQNNNNSELLTSKSHLKSIDFDQEHLGNFNDSNDSIVTDLDGLENDQSLLDDLLYGGQIERKSRPTTAPLPRGKPPTGRSPSPSLARVSSGSHRVRTSRSRSLAQSSDSDTASRVSFDMPNSDLDDSGNGKTKRRKSRWKMLCCIF